MTTFHSGISRKAINLRSFTMDQLFDLARYLRGGPVPGVRMTEDEFLAWAPEKPDAEWADGEVYIMSAANNWHNLVQTWLTHYLMTLIERDDLGGVRNDMYVRLAAQRRLRVPDLMLISKGRLHIIGDTLIDGAPDLIIEVVSPDSQERDRREKFIEYEKAGVLEYWIVDPLSRTVHAYALAEGAFAPLPLDDDGRIASRICPGFIIPVDQLFTDERPKVRDLLAEQDHDKARD